MTSPRTVAVDATELRQSFEFVSAVRSSEQNAWICLDTGKIYWRSAGLGLSDVDIPEDIGESDRYLAIPSKYDLGLGVQLVMDFIARHLPDDYDTVSGFFRRRGAYGRLNALLDRRGMLTNWYEFEERATQGALHAWAAEHGIEPNADSTGA